MGDRDRVSTEHGRIAALDVVRGIAVMGILTMNIAAFAMPFPAYANPAAYGGDSGLDLASWLFNFLIFDGKMRGLFSILFGASTLLVIERATAAGREEATAHYARMVVLLLFGLVHFYFIWFGDILALYALSGMVLYGFRNKTPRALARWAVALLTLSATLFGLVAMSAATTGLPAAPSSAPREMTESRRAIENEVGATSKKIPAELELYRSDYRPIVDSRLKDRTLEPFMSFVSFGLETLGLMLVGMALFKSGFFTGEWHEARYRTWALRCMIIAFPALALLAWWQVDSGFESVRVFAAFIALSMPFDLMMSIAWAALIILWVTGGPMSPPKERIAAVGRMAFTNYLMTSIVMTSIFYGYGLGLFGEVSRAALWLFVFGMWGAMLSWSKPWLDRFQYGPLEWLWRSLSLASWQPMRRSTGRIPA